MYTVAFFDAQTAEPERVWFPPTLTRAIRMAEYQTADGTRIARVSGPELRCTLGFAHGGCLGNVDTRPADKPGS